MSKQQLKHVDLLFWGSAKALKGRILQMLTFVRLTRVLYTYSTNQALTVKY